MIDLKLIGRYNQVRIAMKW